MKPVVLVHGAAMDGSVWELQARALSGAGFDPIAVELPGHGESGGEPAATIKGYAGWLLAYLAMLEVPAHLVGHSMGALIALESARARPDLVRSVTMIGVADRMPVNPGLLSAVAEGDATAFDGMAKWMFARRPVGDPAWSVSDALAVLRRSGPDVAFVDLAACNDYPSAAAAAAGYPGPMLVLAGEQDVMTPPDGVVPIATAAPGLTTVVVEGAGHMLMVERPDVVDDALIGFLESIPD
jgi:pimeloyl-ACP methyl ester carboxylesterase